MRGRKNTTLAGSVGNASAWFQVVLIPRHGAYLMTMRARQLERIAPDRRPTLTSGAHPVARAPVVGRLIASEGRGTTVQRDGRANTVFNRRCCTGTCSFVTSSTTLSRVTLTTGYQAPRRNAQLTSTRRRAQARGWCSTDRAMAEVLRTPAPANSGRGPDVACAR